LRPAQVILAGFVFAIVAGFILLSLPVAKAGPGAASWIEALFTSVSAVCVTGLTVVDTAVYWSGFGQVVILLLIQVGGFGVMTLASVIGLAVARRMSLRTKLNAAAEGSVALILAAQFAISYGRPLGEAAWLGVFHSVSSFNNAGFALFSDNVMSFVDDPLICLPLAVATILGGLGFPVIMQLRRHLREPLKWTMNTRLVLWGTVVLLVLGTAYITVVEWNNPRTLGPLDWPAKILAGFFQSVQTRTAGFNSIDIGGLDDATLLGMDVLMFIGGGPAGTAGGIKITTFAVLFFILLAEIRGEGVVNIFGKRLSRAVHRQAITVVLLAVGVVMAATVALMLLTDLELGVVLFEAVSAFATVGLSTGITPDLPVAGQLILALLMIVGRLGPITFASALALRERSTLYQLPKERPIIG
jgi:Trk-type K+ transport system membrane component